MAVIREVSFFVKVITQAMIRCGYTSDSFCVTNTGKENLYHFKQDQDLIFSVLISLSHTDPDHVYIYLSAEEIDPKKILAISQVIDNALDGKCKIVLM